LGNEKNDYRFHCMNSYNEMKILLIGDCHFRVNNIPQTEVFIRKIDEYLKENHVDVIVVLGDVLDTHERLHSELLNKAISFIKLLSTYTKTYVLVGNHDAINNSIFLTDKHWMNCMKPYPNVVIVDDIVKFNPIPDILFVFCPYVPDGRFHEALHTQFETFEKITCIFAHQSITGGKMGGIVSNAERWEEHEPVVISGHIHDKQWVQPNMYYTGSIMQHSFGDNLDKSMLLLECNMTRSGGDEKVINLPTASLHFHEIDLHLPKKFLVHYAIDQLTKEILENILVERKESDSEYKIIVGGDYEEFKSFKKTTLYKEFVKSKVKISFKQPRKELEQMKQMNEEMRRKYSGVKQQTFFSVLKDLLVSSETEKDELQSIYSALISEQCDVSAEHGETKFLEEQRAEPKAVRENEN
jgi:DNA repair exonuclease